MARERILETFQIDLRREALEMLLIPPTGSGKSLIFQSAPIFFDIVRPKCAKSIVLVISPLVSITLDQVRFLKSIGISAEIIGDEQNCEQTKKRGVFVDQKMTLGLGKISHMTNFLRT